MGTNLLVINFRIFKRQRYLTNTTILPGHPATNRLAERYVGEFKDKLSKIGATRESLQAKLDKFLLTYRATPPGVGKSPSELLMNRQPQIKFSALGGKRSNNEVKIYQDNLDNSRKYVQN